MKRANRHARKRLRCYNMNGDSISLLNHAYAIPRPFDYVTEDDTLGDVFEALSKAAHWPLEWMQVMIGDHRFEWPRLLRHQEHLRVSVMHYAAPNADEIIATVVSNLPDNFQDPTAQGYCLCDFGGCCTLRNAPSCEVCAGCGNNGCCRCAKCGHVCCEVIGDGFQPRYLCPIAGCKPKWAGAPGLRTCETTAGLYCSE